MSSVSIPHPSTREICGWNIFECKLTVDKKHVLIDIVIALVCFAFWLFYFRNSTWQTDKQIKTASIFVPSKRNYFPPFIWLFVVSIRSRKINSHFNQLHLETNAVKIFAFFLLFFFSSLNRFKYSSKRCSWLRRRFITNIFFFFILFRLQLCFHVFDIDFLCVCAT